MHTLRRLLHLLRSSRHEADLREEMETHRSLAQDRLERDGLEAADARAGSRRALGNVTLAREESRDAWSWPTLDHLGQDLRAVLRGLRVSPGFTSVAVLTLALGIGANTALFSIYNALQLRTLPVRDPAPLVLLDGDWTYAIWQAIDRHASEVFDGVFAWSPERFDTAQGGEASLVDAAFVSGAMFDVLGIVPERGRLLDLADDRPGAEPVAVISHRLWQQRYGGADDVIGRRLTLQRVPVTIVGVMPADFFGPEVGRTIDAAVTFAAEPPMRGRASQLEGRWVWWVHVMGRSKPGDSAADAQARLRAIQPQIRAEALPEGSTRMLDAFLADPFELVPAANGRSTLRGRFTAPLTALLAVVALVLLIACASIANLLLARALSRRHELSVRLALGASRWRVARLLLFESLIIAAAGAAMGVVFAVWSSGLLVRQLDSWRGAVSLDLALDSRVLGFTVVVAAFTALLAGVAPAVGVRRVTPNDALKDAGRGIAGDRRFTLRALLVTAQIALSLVLVVGAGLFLRTFTALNGLALGFDPRPLVLMNLDLSSLDLSPAERGLLVERVRAAATETPGVRSAALSQLTPVSGAGWNAGVGADVNAPGDRRRMTWMNAVTPGWFDTMSIPRLRGRDFTDSDTIGAEPVAIVNQAFARRFLQGEPVGQLVHVGGPRDRTPYRIVGVVGDAVYRSLREGIVPTMYVAAAQDNGLPGVLVLSVAPGQRTAIQRTLADRIRAVHPDIVFSFRTFDEFVRAGALQERLVAILSTFFGALGLLLAALGLYGVVSQAVNARRTEIGLRMALGASSSGIMRLIFGRTAVLLAIGLTVGAGASLWLSRFVSALLFGLDAHDPITFAVAAFVLTGAVLLAAWLPARRAAALDPARVLREG